MDYMLMLSRHSVIRFGGIGVTVHIGGTGTMAMVGDGIMAGDGIAHIMVGDIILHIVDTGEDGMEVIHGDIITIIIILLLIIGVEG